MEKTVLNATIDHPVVSTEEWFAIHQQHLKKEKELTRLRDKLASERQALPWTKVDKEYVFDGPGGKVSLADLFDGRNQLIIQHFMFGPDWKEGCVGCSFQADHNDSVMIHLNNHDVSLVVVSRAPFNKIEAFKKRMGWQFKWVSSFENDFNYDYHVSFKKDEINKGKGIYNFSEIDVHEEELPGFSTFYKNKTGEIFHAYSAYARGTEMLVNTYNFLDIAPLGRNEKGSEGNLTDWVRHHDKYNAGGYVDATGKYVAEKETGSCCGGTEETKL